MPGLLLTLSHNNNFQFPFQSRDRISN